MTFSVNLKRLREASGLTQEELATKAGTSKSAISMYERGERFPSEQLLETLADLFNVDMNMLLGKQESAQDCYDEMDEKEKDRFISFPICHFGNLIYVKNEEA